MKIPVRGEALVMLGTCLVALKLLGYITWSWWWVTAPFWGLAFIMFMACFGMGIIAVGIFTMMVMWQAREDRRRRAAYGKRRVS